MPTTIIPLGPRLIVRPDKPSLEVRGIAVPESAQDRIRPESGEVIGVAFELRNQFMKGDRVVFAPYSGIELSVDKEPVVVLGSHEILGVFLDVAPA